MTANIFKLVLGSSRQGEFVHDADADFEGEFPDSLEDAQAAAEELAGRRLHWDWMKERQVWRAEVGYGKAAEIHPCTGPARISVSVAPM